MSCHVVSRDAVSVAGMLNVLSCCLTSRCLCGRDAQCPVMLSHVTLSLWQGCSMPCHVVSRDAVSVAGMLNVLSCCLT